MAKKVTVKIEGLREMEAKLNDLALEVPAPKTFTSVRPSSAVHLQYSGPPMGVEPLPSRTYLPGVSAVQVLYTEIRYVNWSKIAAAVELPKYILTGGRSMATLAALPGVEYVQGVFITRWPAGRLFWPVEVVPAKRVSEMENIITWTAGLMDLTNAKITHPTFETENFRVGFCRLKDVEEPWRKWEVDVGNADPNEWVVTFVTFTN